MADLDNELFVSAQAASSVIVPSELHGLVCGHAAASGLQFDLGGFIELAGADALSHESALTEFVQLSLQQFHFTTDDLAFKPLVADDNEPLAGRISDLSNWCAGFLSGFGGALRSDDGEAVVLPPDVQEILRDFASISGLSDDVEGDEQDEGSFMEIFEFTRVGALLVLALMHDDDDPGADDPDTDE